MKEEQASGPREEREETVNEETEEMRGEREEEAHGGESEGGGENRTVTEMPHMEWTRRMKKLQ